MITLVLGFTSPLVIVLRVNPLKNSTAISFSFFPLLMSSIPASLNIGKKSISFSTKAIPACYVFLPSGRVVLAACANRLEAVVLWELAFCCTAPNRLRAFFREDDFPSRKVWISFVKFTESPYQRMFDRFRSSVCACSCSFHVYTVYGWGRRAGSIDGWAKTALSRLLTAGQAGQTTSVIVPATT